MARLLILRGEILDREVELRSKTLRLGRGPQNDVMLEDQGKSVSRNHAEIRFEGGRYVLVDLESQNGIWVAGSRVPQVVLEPNVVASLGPYRLMLESGGGTSSRPDSGTVTGPAAETGYGDGGRRESRLSPAAGRGGAPRPPEGNWFTRQPIWLVGVAGAAILGVAGFGVYRLTSGSVEEDPPELVELLSDASTALDDGNCAGAKEKVEQALALAPTHAQALSLKARADACRSGGEQPSVTAPPPPLPPSPSTPQDGARAHLAAATQMVDAGNCAGALSEHINVVLATDPGNAEAQSLKTRAESCQAVPGAAPPPATNRVVTVPPEKGGLAALPGEQQRDYEARVRAMKARYDEAATELSRGAYQRAETLLNGILRDAGDRYLDAPALLLRARNLQHEQALKIYQGARDLENKGEWDKAIQELQRAHEADANVGVDGDVKRITEKKTTLGLERCEQGNSYYTLKSDAAARQAFEEALRLLPSSHPCAQDAKKKLADLRE